MGNLFLNFVIMSYDVNKYIQNKWSWFTISKQYENQLLKLKESWIIDTSSIEETVDKAIKNLADGKKRFVIYWEPQSWKTNMMIALTAKLIDSWYNKIIVLVNDNLQLFDQNLFRFQKAQIKPTPQDFDHYAWEKLLTYDNFIIFSKKNTKNLSDVFNLTKKINNLLILDDEADYATPNSKVNKEWEEKTKINELIWDILWNLGAYIWVTATPARLDLNLTFDNSVADWINFNPYNWYNWEDTFFPVFWTTTKDNCKLKYKLNILSDEADYTKELKIALFSFMVNVAYLNIFINKKELNYVMLIHTSYKKDAHYDDLENIKKSFSILKNLNHQKSEKYLSEIVKIIEKKFPELNNDSYEKILDYINDNASWGFYKVINSWEKNKDKDIEKLTDPSVSPFTVAIWWNILSRGLTFNNLLSMFFLRTTKSWKLQQDTYIQMARMFWNRNKYLDFFELNIPESIYSSWWESFHFHRISFRLLRSWVKPKWLWSKRSTPVSASSINKEKTVTNYENLDDNNVVTFDQNWEISTGLFDYNDDIINIVNIENKVEWNEAIDILLKLRKEIWDNKLDAILWDINDYKSSWIMLHPSIDISTHKISNEQIKSIEKNEWLLPNVWATNPNIRLHCRIYFNPFWKARLYLFFKRRENLINWKRVKTISRKK